MNKKYIVALDQGTTSSRSVLFNENGEANRYRSARIYTDLSHNQAG